MMRRDFLSTTAAAALQPPAQNDKPDILLILADDLGYGDLGCYGQKQVRTPHLDRLAAEGIRFSEAYAGSTVCAPSRCCLMTGFHTGHARTRGNRNPDLPLRPQDVTVTERLKSAGYRTGLFGKWSLGGLGSTGYPTRKGFDEWFGFFSQTHAHNYYPEHMLHNEREFLLRGNFGAKKTDYAPDLITRHAVEFIQHKDPRPWFAHVCFTIPHANNELGRDTGNGMEVPADTPYSGRDWPQVEKNFAAMVTRLDADVGKLLDALKASGRDRNTFILFSSDNGPHREGGHDPDFFDSNGPLRGIKRDLYEGGIRVPALARWPARIRPGEVSDHAWAFWDFLPTACEAAGVTVPAGIDGISFRAALSGKPQRAHDYLYWEFHERGLKQAVRTGDWKAVKPSGAPIELYNLRDDLGEKTDLAARQPEIVKRIERILGGARTESDEWPLAAAKP